jgi:hypothetical protein
MDDRRRDMSRGQQDMTLTELEAEEGDRCLTCHPQGRMVPFRKEGEHKMQANGVFMCLTRYGCTVLRTLGIQRAGTQERSLRGDD